MVRIKELKEDDEEMTTTGSFWGVAMEGGKRYSQKVITPFHISMAALEPGSGGEDASKNNGIVTVWLGIKGFDYLLCTLKHDSIFNCNLDYELDVGEELELSVNGKGTVYLTGYLRLEDDPPEDWDMDDEEGEEMVEVEESEEEKEEEDDDVQIIPMMGKRKSKTLSLVDVTARSRKVAKAEMNGFSAVKGGSGPEQVKVAPEKVEVVDADAVVGTKKKKNKKKRKSVSTMDESLDEMLQGTSPKLSPKTVPTKNAAAAAVVSGPSSGTTSSLEASVDAAVKSIREEVDRTAASISPKKEAVVASPSKKKPLDGDIAESPKKANVKSPSKNTKPLIKEESEKQINGDVGEVVMDVGDSVVNDSGVAETVKAEVENTPQRPASEKKKKKKKRKTGEFANDSADDSMNVSVVEDAKSSPAKNKPVKGVSAPEKKIENTSGGKLATKTLPGGTIVATHAEGEGPPATKGTTVFVKYTGRLKSTNAVFDSNTGPKGSPLKYVVGSKALISGFAAGLEGMKQGGKRRLIIPSKQAYGNSSPDRRIPPNSDLVFDVEVVKMMRKKKLSL